MADLTHLEILRQGVHIWNAWRDAHPDLCPDLEGAVLGADPTLLLEPDEEAPRVFTEFDHINFRRTNLKATNFSGASFWQADFREANLSHADFSGASFSGANLSNTTIRQASCAEAKFIESNLTDADLSKTFLTRADFTDARLERSSFTQAFLNHALFIRTHLHHADFSQAVLCNTIFEETPFLETVFTHAIIGWTKLGGIDMRQMKGIDTLVHQGPSEISVNTLLYSQGNIPETFLIKTGVPFSVVHALLHLFQNIPPQQQTSCFICCAKADFPFAQQLQHDLQKQGIRCWINSTAKVQVGKTAMVNTNTFWKLAGPESVKHFDKLILLLSEKVFDDSSLYGIITECRKREKSLQHQIVFPIDVKEWQSSQMYQLLLQQLLNQISQ